VPNLWNTEETSILEYHSWPGIRLLLGQGYAYKAEFSDGLAAY